MVQLTDAIAVPDDDLLWKFARSGGPGGQNVNKVASKAVLTWDLAGSPHVPPEIKDRVRRLFPRFATTEGALVIASQRYRDQDRNRDDCLDKLRELLRIASVVPKKRKKTKPTRASHHARLADKKRRAVTKQTRRRPEGD